MEATPIEVRVHQDGPRITFRLRGELDLASTKGLGDRLRQVVDGCTQVDIDLEEVTFLDSTGIATLVQTSRFHRAGGRECNVVAAQGQPAKVLEITGIDQMEKLVERYL